jgi:hypothetical protein
VVFANFRDCSPFFPSLGNEGRLVRHRKELDSALARSVETYDVSRAVVTSISVKKQPAGFRRRKLSSVVRKAITSYYTEQEQTEIEKAARQQQISKSSFVASAALREARRLNH